MDVGVISLEAGVSGAVVAYRLVFVEGLANGLPGSRPVVVGIVITNVNISAGEGDIGVETVSRDSSVSAALYKAVTACVVGNNSTVFGRAKVISPRRRGIRAGNHVLFVFQVKITVLHRNKYSFKIIFARIFYPRPLHRGKFCSTHKKAQFCL